MEKTLTINISGWVFNINEDAYEKLTQYFKKLKNHFKKEEGGDEIVADIEARIAELFKERITDQTSVIAHKDVDDVIKIMGQPFEMEEEPLDTDYSTKSSSWQAKPGKKLYRDPINAHLGGVASGLGKYFNLDPIVIRVIFLLLMTTGGLGIILYIVLWILVPEASTTSDRIRMEGKKVNVKNIEDKVREETEYLKDRLNDFSEEAMDVYHKTGPARKKSLKKIESFVKGFGRVLLRILKFLLGLILFIYGAALLVGAAMLYFNWIPELHFDGFFIQGISLPVFLGSFIIANKYTTITLIAVSFVVFIPIIMMVFHGIRFLFNLKRNKTVGTIAWQSWVVALIISLGMSYSTLTAFHEDALNITKYDFEQVQSDTLSLRLNTNSYYEDILASDNHTVISQDYHHPIIHDHEFYGEPYLEILESSNENFELKYYLSANGNSEANANEQITEILYQFKMDSAGILLDPYFKLKPQAKWRNQQVRIKLFIPDGKYISIDHKIRLHFKKGYYWRNRLYEYRNGTSYWKQEKGNFLETRELKESEEPALEAQEVEEIESIEKIEPDAEEPDK